MLETNYKKIYVGLYLKKVPFASYMKDGNYIIECKDKVIEITNDDCYLNEAKYSVETILSMI